MTDNTDSYRASSCRNLLCMTLNLSNGGAPSADHCANTMSRNITGDSNLRLMQGSHFLWNRFDNIIVNFCCSIGRLFGVAVVASPRRLFPKLLLVGRRSRGDPRCHSRRYALNQADNSGGGGETIASCLSQVVVVTSLQVTDLSISWQCRQGWIFNDSRPASHLPTTPQKIEGRRGEGWHQRNWCCLSFSPSKVVFWWKKQIWNFCIRSHRRVMMRENSSQSFRSKVVLLASEHFMSFERRSGQSRCSATIILNSKYFFLGASS